MLLSSNVWIFSFLWFVKIICLASFWSLQIKQESEKVALAESTGLDQKQINNWFINQRKRHWKPSEDMQFMVMDGLHPQNAALYMEGHYMGEGPYRLGPWCITRLWREYTVWGLRLHRGSSIFRHGMKVVALPFGPIAIIGYTSLTAQADIYYCYKYQYH